MFLATSVIEFLGTETTSNTKVCRPERSLLQASHSGFFKKLGELQWPPLTVTNFNVLYEKITVLRAHYRWVAYLEDQYFRLTDLRGP